MLTILRNNGNLDKEDPQQINFFFQRGSNLDSNWRKSQRWKCENWEPTKESSGNVKTENQPKNPLKEGKSTALPIQQLAKAIRDWRENFETEAEN